jgi:uncharacterized protein (TIGR02453 family)
MSANLPVFTRFGPEFLAFFNDLSANQNRDWFQARKSDYENHVKYPMQALLMALNTEFEAAKIPLSADPKRSISRINRDVRFSNDKSPYKTYISGTMTREAGDMSPGLVYLQFGQDELFIGAGFYLFEPDALAAFRQAVAREPERWAALTDQLTQDGSPIERADTLKRMPKGMEEHATSPVADDLKLKSFVCKLRLTPSDFESPLLADKIVTFAKVAMPLLTFGWEALGISVG